MKPRSIIPTLTLLAGVGGITGLACLDRASWSAAPSSLWQALFAPQAARADDASAGGASVMRNPFVSENESPVAESSVETATAKTTEAEADRPLERYRSAPVLEPIPARRTNPHLASTGDDPEPLTAPRGAAPPQPRMPLKDRYGDRQGQPVVRVAHTDKLSDNAGAATIVAEPVVPREESTEPSPASERSGQEAALESLPTADTNERAGGGVTLQWVTPGSVTVGQETTCQLVVRNASDAVAQGVLVQVQLPDSVELGPTEPRSTTEGTLVKWRLGDMSAGATVTAQLNFTPREQGDLTPRAAVTFTRQVAATIQIVEPRLAMSIEGPTETVVGQPAPFQFRVTNKGTGPAMGVEIDMALAEGLEAGSGSKSRYTIGTLSPGESRHVQVMISGSARGEYAIEGRVLVGDAALDKVGHTLRIVQPALAVAMEGPKLRFVDRRAAYTIKVQNPGPAAIDNVQLSESIPDGFRFVEASSGGSFDRNARQVAWFVGRLEANETATVGVQLIAIEAGDHRLNAEAKSDVGVIGEAETTTRVKGAPRVTIDVSEDDDPVEVDGETIYRIRLANQGSTPAQRVQFAAEVPREMQILEINGPAPGTIKGQQLVFPAIESLEPGQSATYDVHVKCSKAGQVRFKAYFRSEDTPTPVLEEEATRIYAD